MADLRHPRTGTVVTVESRERADVLRSRGYADVVTGPPSRSASKAEWVDYAVSQGTARDEAEAMTRDDLAEAHG